MKKTVFLSAMLLAFCAGAEIRLTAPVQDSVVPLHNDLQKMYLTMPRAKRRIYFADQKSRNEMRSATYYPLPTELRWEVDDEPAPYTVLVSETPDFKDSAVYTFQSTSGKIDNLKIASRYYWKVISGSSESKAGSFITEDLAPRLIRVPGVPNVRDLGGRIGLNGRRVRQGLVYRTAGLNDNAEAVYADPTPEVLQRIEKTLTDRKELLKDTEKLSAENFVPVQLSKEWTIFRPDFKRMTSEKFNEAARCKEIPETLFGAKPQKIESVNNNFVLKLIDEGIPAVFMQSFEAEADGWTAVEANADWFWVLGVNGEICWDTREGNLSGDIMYTINFPVKKGKNLLVCALGSGSAGFAFHCKAVETPNVKKCVESRKYVVDSLRNVKGEIIDRKPGASRVKGENGEYMRTVMGIKSDIDLRSSEECYGMEGSPLGPKVTWFHYSSASYANMRGEAGREAFTKVFRVFLDRNNYPIDFHCIAGQDRTGAVAFILNALLGVPEDQLYLDWESTGFWNGDAGFNHKNLFDYLVKVFDQYPGKTINERVYAYVISLGFTEKDIETFRSIMLE